MPNKRLQAIAATKEPSAVAGAADYHYQFDVNDAENCVGLVKEGLRAGLRLAKMARRFRKRAPKAEIQIFLVTYPEYVDDDGQAWYVGTEESVAARLSELKDN